MNLNGVKKLNIPIGPGIYQFLDKNKKIIYIGKAANLKNRVLSYWRKNADHSPAKFSMMKKIIKISWIKTDSEIEALLLESNLIKKHQPQYNVSLRDDKRYVYIKISTEEEFPRIFISRKLDRSGKYFGPFVSAEAVKETLKTIRKIWPFRSCWILPKSTCLYYHIGKCPGPCEDKISKSDFQKIIKQIRLFLEGKRRRVVKEIESEIKIKEEGGKENLKIAKSLKYTLFNLKKVLEHANILSLIDKYAGDVVELAKILNLSKIPQRIEGYDVSNIFGQEAVGSMVVFKDGEADKNEYRKFKIKTLPEISNDTAMLKEILNRRFKHSLKNSTDKWPLPDLIIIDGGKGQVNAGAKILKEQKLDIPIIGLSKGNGRRSSMAKDKIFFTDEKSPLELPLASPGLHILKRVRDEAHRFAIEYYRKLKSKKLLR